MKIYIKILYDFFYKCWPHFLIDYFDNLYYFFYTNNLLNKKIELHISHSFKNIYYKKFYFKTVFDNYTILHSDGKGHEYDFIILLDKNRFFKTNFKKITDINMNYIKKKFVSSKNSELSEEKSLKTNNRKYDKKIQNYTDYIISKCNFKNLYNYKYILFIPRKKNDHRRHIHNQDYVANQLEKKLNMKVIICHFEDIELEKQITLSYYCSMFITCHGGGILNCIYTKNNKPIIELLPQHYTYTKYIDTYKNNYYNYNIIRCNGEHLVKKFLNPKKNTLKYLSKGTRNVIWWCLSDENIEDIVQIYKKSIK